MTGATIAAALVARGLDPTELAAKQSLYSSVIEHHAVLRGRPPAHVFWVPGRLEVFGKHTDYAGGRTLVCAVPRGFAVVASPRSDDVVRVSDTRRGEEVTIEVSTTERAAFSGWRHYAEVSVRRLARNFPAADLGADIVLASDLPRASGMSSSSALIIAIVSALGRVAALTRHASWKANIRSGLDAAGYYACIENGRSFAALLGDSGVGTHGGSEDHAAIMEGRPRQVSAFAFVPARAISAAAMPEHWRFVIAPSGVAARKTGEAREPYNRLSAGAANLLDAWIKNVGKARSLAEALRSDAGAADRLRTLAGLAATDEMPAPWLRDRLEHFIREDARILPALAAFDDGDRRALDELSAGSQADAESLLRNQVSATSALAASARGLGAFAACSFGAGFGGAVWALIERRGAEEFAHRWHPDAFTMTPGLPLIEVSGV